MESGGWEGSGWPLSGSTPEPKVNKRFQPPVNETLLISMASNPLGRGSD